MFRTPMTLDRMNRNLTVVASALVAIGMLVVLTARSGPGAFAFAIGAAALALAWAMSPCEIVVDAGELRVVRRAWPPLRIPLGAIAAAAPLDNLGAWPIRLFGVGGFFGSYGLFSTKTLGRFRLYATRRGQAVIVRRVDSKLPIVLTPDDVEGTVRAIDRRPIFESELR
jgi:hypothetical protein